MAVFEKTTPNGEFSIYLESTHLDGGPGEITGETIEQLLVILYQLAADLEQLLFEEADKAKVESVNGTSKQVDN